MASIVITDAEVIELIASEHGGFANATTFTFTPVSDGTLYWQYEAPEAALDSAEAVEEVQDGGIPMVSGQYASEELRAGSRIFVTAGNGEEIEVRISARGAK